MVIQVVKAFYANLHMHLGVEKYVAAWFTINLDL